MSNKITNKTMDRNRTTGSVATEIEQTKQRLIQEMNEEMLLEKENMEKQVLVEEQQAIKRKLQLENTWFMLLQNGKAYTDYRLEKQKEENWSQYMTCNGLPDPSILWNLNTFMYLWSLEEDKISKNNIVEKCDIVTYLLEKMDNIIMNSKMAESYIKDCKAIRQQLREKLQLSIDMSSYYLLRHIERNMVRIDLKNTRFAVISNKLICCIWAMVQLPISLKNGSEKERKPIEVHFENVDLTIKMPLDVNCYSTAIRLLQLTYDHYSDQGKSFQLTNVPENYRTDIDLLTYCMNEYKTKETIRQDQAEQRRLLQEERKNIIERIANPNSPPLSAPLADSSEQPVKLKGKGKPGKTQKEQSIRMKKKIDFEKELERLPYVPTPDEVILQKQDEFIKEMKKVLLTKCDQSEINLRKYIILGGVYHIDLAYQPPQPKDMQRNIYLTTLQLPKDFKRVPFYKPYVAPPAAPESERTPEVIESEMKALETAMEKLALVTLKLPDTVLWFEPPLVAHWIPENRMWSTENIHDIKYNEEKQQIAFRTGKLGIHGLAAYKFVNLPFQSWEVKPEKVVKNKSIGVLFNITAAIVQAEFIVKEDMICLHSLAGVSTLALQDLFHNYMHLDSLIKKMRARGCDLFPESDAFCYVKGLAVKHSITEKHLTECIGLLSTAYTFSWSRWNATRNSRQIVLQMKEIHGCIAKQQSSQTVLVTPLETIAVQCTEVSSEFNQKPIKNEENKFYADLYHLALYNAGIKSRLLIQDISFKLAITVSKLLQSTNVISMSS